MNICVCICSYKRPLVKTLKYIPYAKVFIDKKEEKEYREANEKIDLHICDDGIQGNVSRVRNYMLDTMFAEGFDAVCLLDDDIKTINRFEVNGFFGYEKKKVPTEQFMYFLQMGTRLCEEWGYKLWGINCNNDKMSYRHYTPFSTKGFIGGPFNVHLKSDIRYDESLPLKEDYDLLLQHANKYRGVLRLNMYHYECEQATNTGGCAMYRTGSKEEEQFNLLQKKWGSKIVQRDKGSRRGNDFNPIIKIPIGGV